jgi:hypothetical protein
LKFWKRKRWKILVLPTNLCWTPCAPDTARKFMPVLYNVHRLWSTHLFRKHICRSICGTFIWQNW